MVLKNLKRNIYFSHVKDLKVPLEGYMDVDFKGDKLIWTIF